MGLRWRIYPGLRCDVWAETWWRQRSKPNARNSSPVPGRGRSGSRTRRLRTTGVFKTQARSHRAGLECLKERIRPADFSHWECSADCINLSSLQNLWPFYEWDGKFWKTLSMSNGTVIQFWFRKQLSDLVKGGCGLGEVKSRHEVGTPVWGSAITADKDDGGVGGSSEGGEKIVRFWKYSCKDKRQMMVFQKERVSF